MSYTDSLSPSWKRCGSLPRSSLSLYCGLSQSQLSKSSSLLPPLLPLDTKTSYSDLCRCIFSRNFSRYSDINVWNISLITIGSIFSSIFCMCSLWKNATRILSSPRIAAYSPLSSPKEGHFSSLPSPIYLVKKYRRTASSCPCDFSTISASAMPNSLKTVSLSVQESSFLPGCGKVASKLPKASWTENSLSGEGRVSTKPSSKDAMSSLPLGSPLSIY
ncbi:MAG: hypothetical protein ACD_80C00051G0001, partial [uncultured bacterium (gcode 4)]